MSWDVFCDSVFSVMKYLYDLATSPPWCFALLGQESRIVCIHQLSPAMFMADLLRCLWSKSKADHSLSPFSGNLCPRWSHGKIWLSQWSLPWMVHLVHDAVIFFTACRLILRILALANYTASSVIKQLFWKHLYHGVPLWWYVEWERFLRQCLATGSLFSVFL